MSDRCSAGQCDTATSSAVAGESPRSANGRSVESPSRNANARASWRARVDNQQFARVGPESKIYRARTRAQAIRLDASGHSCERAARAQSETGPLRRRTHGSRRDGGLAEPRLTRPARYLSTPKVPRPTRIAGQATQEIR